MKAADNGVARGINRFSSSLYEQLAKSGDRNLVASPFNVASALSMALAGARGETATEIAKMLGQDPNDPKYHAQLAELVDQIVQAANGDGNRFLNANGLWVQKDFKILPGFRDTLQNVYHAPPGLVDFVGNLDASREEINAWTERHTEGKIQRLFAPGTLDADTRLVLASAVYFYGKWERSFRRSETRPATFTLRSGAAEQADFMNQTARFGYGEKPTGQILEMRYAGTGLAFDILLPRKGASIESLGAGTVDGIEGWLGSLGNRMVETSVPKFRIEAEFPLAPTLARLGMRTAFTASADFSAIDDRRDLRLSRVIHKAYIDVAEEGTEAAAATGVGVAMVAMIHQSNPVFRADHPFLFLIRDTRSGLILFTGRVMNPKR